MTAYNLSIITPQGMIFNGSVNSLTAPGEMGRVGVLGSHAAMIMSLKRGMVKVETADGLKYFETEQGILEVKPSHDVILLVEGAQVSSNQLEAAEI